jgi:hypothetical protein
MPDKWSRFAKPNAPLRRRAIPGRLGVANFKNVSSSVKARKAEQHHKRFAIDDFGAPSVSLVSGFMISNIH